MLTHSYSKFTSHSLLYFQYSTCNVAAIDNKSALIDRFAGCECNCDAQPTANAPSEDTTSSACTTLCACLQGFNLPYGPDKLLNVSGASGTHHPPLFECHRECRCDQSCPTRVVQCGVKHRLEVFKADGKGYGLATLEVIKQNSFVCEYAGEVLTAGTARIRACKHKADPTSNFYLFVLNEHVTSSTDCAQVNEQEQKVIRTYIDPTLIGNAARFINHSCDPNLFMVPVRIGCAVPSLALFALRDIGVGEELSFSYSGVFDSQLPATQTETNDSLEARHQDDMSKICNCSAENCTGYLPFDDSLFGE